MAEIRKGLVNGGYRPLVHPILWNKKRNWVQKTENDE